MFGLMDRGSGYLFSSSELRVIIENQRNAMRQEVEQIESNRLLNTSPSDLARYLVQKYSLTAPALRRDAWTVSQEETQVDVRHDQNRWIDDRNRPCMVPGQLIEIEVPIEGDKELLYAQASTMTPCPPRAVIRGQALILQFKIPHDAPDYDFKKAAEKILNEIDQYLSWTQRDLNAFNQVLPVEAERAITSRRERLLKNSGRVATLGIPLNNRTDAPRTYALPEIRKKIVPVIPVASSTPYAPEPILSMDLYEHILNVVQNMAHVMERSPSAFQTMGEENLRQHFLVQLNGQFEGAATGETFNYNGKTDIIIRASDRNVFIAECKYWKGPKLFRETIDQLLSYKAWRDTKTAILVFNRDTAMSTAIAGVDSVAKAHPNFKRQVEWRHESGFRYVMHHIGDTNREFILTVIVFDVPGLAKEP